MQIRWNEEKNIDLQKNRGISFEDIEEYILSGKVIRVVPHFNKEKYPHQKMILIQHENYLYYVPFVSNQDGDIFLKTIIPSRKLTKKYLSS